MKGDENQVEEGLGRPGKCRSDGRLKFDNTRKRGRDGEMMEEEVGRERRVGEKVRSKA